MPRKSMRPAARRPRRRAAPRSTVPARLVQGRGFYKGFGGHLGRSIGALAGAANMATGQVVPFLTPAVGGSLGHYLGRKGAEATGFGAYRMPKSNSLLVPELPSIRNARTLEGATVVRHKEYLGDVISSSTAGGGNVVVYPIQPGLSTTFPWLSAIANSFQEYKVNGMLVEFRSTSGNAVSSGNTALGEVVLSTTYNSASPFTGSSSKSALMNEEFAVSTTPARSVIHAVECAPNQTPIDKLYTRSSPSGVNPPASGTDIRLYDLGTLAVGTFGQQAASVNLGELWITYEVILYKPRITGT